MIDGKPSGAVVYGSFVEYLFDRLVIEWVNEDSSAIDINGSMTVGGVGYHDR
jgi:hypothetical protein